MSRPLRVVAPNRSRVAAPVWSLVLGRVVDDTTYSLRSESDYRFRVFGASRLYRLGTVTFVIAAFPDDHFKEHSSFFS